MRIGADLRRVRRAAGLSQRMLARRSGVAQPTIARIEQGQIDPRLGTVQRLLEACGSSLTVQPQLGMGVDRTQIRELLRLTPAERLERLQRDAAGLAAFDGSLRR